MIEWCFISVIAEVAFNGEAYISSRSTSIEDDSLADNHDGDAFDRSTSTEDSFADNHDGGSPAEGTLVEDLLADNQDGDAAARSTSTEDPSADNQDVDASASCSDDRDIDNDSSRSDCNAYASDGDDEMKKSESNLVEKPEQPEIQEEGISVQTICKKYDKRHACLFCGKLMVKIARHLERAHRKKPEIVRVLSLKKGSSVRRNLLDNLRNRGNFKHNSEVLKNGKGIIIPKKRQRRTIRGKCTRSSFNDYVACQYCQATLMTKEMPKHSERCRGLKEAEKQIGHAVENLTEICASKESEGILNN